jgi:hypothetical protein
MERPASIATLAAFQALFGVLEIVVSAIGDPDNQRPAWFAYWLFCFGATNLFSAFATWQLSWLGFVSFIGAIVGSAVANSHLPTAQQAEIPFVMAFPILVYSVVVCCHWRRMHWALRGYTP